MIYDNLILNKKIWEMLSNSFKTNKVPNAFIFSGDIGVGKEAHAIEFSALLNCKRVNKTSPCGDCRSCIKIKSFKHEELHLIHATPPPKSTSSSMLDQKVIDELNKNYKEKSSNPYHQINIGKSRTIPISSIRNLKKKLYYSKSDENWSVVVIFDAEKLCANKAESANSLLKILEEPPERTLFILVTSSINSLIPTIQSRCQKVYFKNLSATDLKDYSIEYLNNNLTLETIEMSLGSISRLIENSDGDKVKTFKKIGADFFSNDMKSIEKLLITFNKIKTIDSNELLNYLNLIKISAKDLYLLNSSANSNTISFSFLSDDYKKILESFPNSNWNGIIELIDDTISNISKNINISLETYSLMINVRSCLQGRRVNRFHQQIGSGI